MREVDRRSKYDRRVFLKGAATAVPAVAVATSAGLGISDAWADDATALTPATLKTLVKVARDIYPHDFLGDSYYITAVKPWDGKAAKDPAVKALIDGRRRPARQDARRSSQGALCRGAPGKPTAWRCCSSIEQTDVLPEGPRRPRRLALQPERALAEVRLRGLLRRAWRLHQARLRRHRLAPEGLKRRGQRTVREESTWQNSI